MYILNTCNDLSTSQHLSAPNLHGSQYMAGAAFRGSGSAVGGDQGHRRSEEKSVGAQIRAQR